MPEPDEAARAQADWFGERSEDAVADRLAALFDLAQDPGAPDVDWFRALARRTGGPVLELGCGSGRVAVPLAQDGHAVVGLERSPAMLARAERRARRAGVEIRWVEGDMRDFTFAEPFALVVVAQNTFLMLEPDDRFACLARVREHLARDGRFALDVFQPDPARIASFDGSLAEEWAGDDPETGTRVTRWASGHANVDGVEWRVRYDEVGSDGVVRRLERTANLHYLYRREAELLFAAAGFVVESMHGDYDGGAVTPRSPKLLVVARRRERGEARERRGG